MSDDSPLWQAIVALPPRGAEQHRYLLINQAAWQFEPKVIASLSGFDRMPLLGQPISAATDGATPFLLRLDGHIEHNAATHPLRQLCNTGYYASAISVIDSALPMPALAAAITDRCEAQLPDHQDVLLRIFDTRVLEAVLDHFSAEQKSQLVACATQWWFATREAELAPLYVSPWPTQDLFKPPWRLTQQQENALVDASEADAMVDLLKRRNVEALLALPYPRRYLVVTQLLAQCRALNIDAISDQAAYCTLVLMRGLRLEDDPVWQALLPRVKGKQMSFQAALQTASEAAA
jgi:Domain of unknown function (DUF4123)